MVESVRALMFLVGAYYFLQAIGGNPGLHFQALQKFLKEVLGFSPSQSAVFFTFLTIPWMIKPLYGFISDFFPIFGSRRKSYFIITGFLAAGSYWLLSWLGPTEHILYLFLFSSALGIAFSDVLCDAVMVERGQLLKATDRLQAAQWFSLGVAGIIISFSKGYIAQYLSFVQAVRLSSLAPLVMIIFTVFVLHEHNLGSSREVAGLAWQGLKKAVCSKSIWSSAAFLFLFNCNPNLGAVFYYYEKDVLKFSDVLIGYIDTVGSIAFVVGTGLFGVTARRLSTELLLRLIIVSGVLGNLLYLLFRDAPSAFVVTAVSGLISVLAFLGILTLAARVCPKYAEGTVFALLMSVLNAGGNLGSIIGGRLYEVIGYSRLVIISAVFTAAMWFFLPLARKGMKQAS